MLGSLVMETPDTVTGNTGRCHTAALDDSPRVRSPSARINGGNWLRCS